MEAGQSNSMNIEIVATVLLSDAQQRALDAMGSAAYAPSAGTPAATPSPVGDTYHWASPQWSILVWEEGELVSHIGLTVREISHNGEPKRIGGVGGVMTAPSRQGRGLATQGLRAAADYLQSDLAIAYALLFCRAELVPFYGRLGWQPFRGDLFIEQPNQKKLKFTEQGAMLLDLQEQAPLDGELDLQGLPW